MGRDLKPRIVNQFSCGAASATATKIILSEYPPDRVTIINAFIKEEHEDNRRFLRDCERWFKHPIIELRDEKYGASTVEVFKKVRYLKGRRGAPCSRILKKEVLNAFLKPSDIVVLGYTTEEEDRVDGYLDANNGRRIICPLIERKLTKADCLAIVERAGIELPITYRMGYNNANCIGCVKGGAGYWNRIRKDFPDSFVQIANIELRLGTGAYLFRNRRTGERYGLYELREDEGKHKEPEISCSAHCELVDQEIREFDEEYE